MNRKRIGMGVMVALALAVVAPGAQAQIGYQNSRIIGGGPFVLMGNGFNQAYYLDGRGAIPVVDPSLLLANPAANSAPASIPRTSDSIEARIEKSGKLLIRWQGEPRAVSRITVALLDQDRKVIKEQTITRLPAEARFTLTNKTSYYRVVIEYIDGTTNTIVSVV